MNTPNTEHHLNEVGLSGKVIAVHKADEAGVLEIDAFTGQVLPNQHDRPEWGNSLFIAQLTERHQWYTQRLGREAYAASDLSTPETLAFEDLGWLGVDTAHAEGDVDGNEIHFEADNEFRMEILANILGVDREGDNLNAAHVEIARDDTRTEAEMKDFREAQEQGFKSVTG